MAFGTYPALAIRQPDFGRTLAIVAAMKGAGLRNELLRRKMEREDRVRGLTGEAVNALLPGDGASGAAEAAPVPSGGAAPALGGTGTPAALSTPAAPAGADVFQGRKEVPSALIKLGAVAPEKALNIVKFVDALEGRERDEIKRKNLKAGAMLAWFNDLPEEQKTLVWSQLRAQAKEKEGLDVSSVPEKYDPRMFDLLYAQIVGTDQYIEMSERREKESTFKVQTAQGILRIKPTGPMKNALAMGLEPGTPEFNEFVKKAVTRPLSVTQIDARTPPEEREEMKAYGKGIGGAAAENYNRIQESARTATTRIGNMDQVNVLLDMAYTGAFGETALGLVKGLNALNMSGLADFIGGGSTSMGPAEAGQAISRKMALEGRKDMPGPMSDKDREFLVGMNPNLGMTKEGRHLLAEVFKQRGAHVRDIAKHARAYKTQQEAKGGRFDEGFHEYLEEKMGGKSWFSAEMHDRLKLLSPVKVESEAEAKALPKGQVVELNGRFMRVK